MPTRNANGRRTAVLFVTPYLPSPPRFGGQRRLHGLIAGMAESHDVSILSFVDPHENQSEALRATELYCRHVVTVPNHRAAAGPIPKRLLQLRSLLTSQSYEWLVHRDDAFAHRLEDLLITGHFDVVHFEFPYLAGYRSEHPRRRTAGPVVLLDEHNIEYDIGRQTTRAGASALRRAYSAINCQKLEVEERRAWAGLDGCTLTSPRDQQILLAEAPLTRTAVVPNGVDLDLFRPSDGPAPQEPATLLFFGAIDYYPNTDGLLFFLNEVWPLLQRRAGGIRLRVVGRRPPASILRWRGPDIEITGAVDDVRPHVARATVVIVPLRIGGGTRLKILEAMAMGKALVSTTVGAEGIDVASGHHLLLADDAPRFAAAILHLLDAPGLAVQLGTNARRFVVARHGWRASVERLSSFYREVLEARGGP